MLGGDGSFVAGKMPCRVDAEQIPGWVDVGQMPCGVGAEQIP